MSDTDLAAQGPLVQFCNECGSKLASSMKFCSGCGSQTALMPGATRAGAPQGGSEATAPVEEPRLTLLQGWGFYAGACLGISLLIMLKSAPIGVLGYLAIGVFMSRFVMRRLVEWHPQYNTLNNVVGAKVWMVVLWPVRMLFLLVQLSVNHVL